MTHNPEPAQRVTICLDRVRSLKARWFHQLLEQRQADAIVRALGEAKSEHATRQMLDNHVQRAMNRRAELDAELLAIAAEIAVAEGELEAAQADERAMVRDVFGS